MPIFTVWPAGILAQPNGSVAQAAGAPAAALVGAAVGGGVVGATVAGGVVGWGAFVGAAVGAAVGATVAAGAQLAKTRAASNKTYNKLRGFILIFSFNILANFDQIESYTSRYTCSISSDHLLWIRLADGSYGCLTISQILVHPVWGMVCNEDLLHIVCKDMDQLIADFKNLLGQHIRILKIVQHKALICQ
jgi:hypothetical protein